MKTRSVRSAAAGPAPRTVEFIEVTLTDIETANALAPELLGRSLDELPPQTRRLLNHLRRLVKEKMAEGKMGQGSALFSRRDVFSSCGWTYAQVRTHLERLTEVELVAVRGGRNGSTLQYELLTDAHAPEETWPIGLIDPAALMGKHCYDADLAEKPPDLDHQNAPLGPPCETAPSRPAALNGSDLTTTLPPCANAHLEAARIAVVS